MFMFQNGLLMSFIPEILMVIGYLLCLFTPGVKPQNSPVNDCTAVIQVTNIEHPAVSTYQVSSRDFKYQVKFEVVKKGILPLFVPKLIHIHYKSTFAIPAGNSYVDFSRPPPIILT